MIIENDVEIPMADGTRLRCNVYRPDDGRPCPVVMTHGPYGKDAHFADAFAPAWEVLKKLYPGIDTEGSSGRYLRWETPDPERWVPRGYVVIAVDSRGSGMSPGKLHVYSPQQMQDYFECIEWAGTQSWSSGKVGLIGISYYAINQWQVASLRPPHLAAICPWEGCSDPYRDSAYHGGIYSSAFSSMWWPKQILSIQHGNGKTTYFSRDTGKPTVGEALGDQQLAANRVDYIAEKSAHHFDDGWFAERRPDLSRIEVPVLSAGNWGGMGLHLRGNVEGWLGAGSKEKWLEMHGGTHYESFYLPEFVEMQMRFFDCFLKGHDNGWRSEPPVQLHIRHPGARFVLRKEREWPLARTQWTPYYLDTARGTLATEAPAQPHAASYAGLGRGIELSTAPMQAATEITGPVSATLWVQSDSTDMDLFCTLRAYDPEGRELTFRGATDPAVPIAQGWLRVSHRATDAQRSRTGRPWRAHRQAEPMVPGQPCRVEVEIWPTCIVLPPGYRLALRIDGADFEREGAPGPRKGSGPFLHVDPKDRPAEIFGVRNTILSGGEHDSHLLLPVIPAQP